MTVSFFSFLMKGASVVLYRNNNIRKYQVFAYSEWPGGLFGSPGLAGTRPGLFSFVSNVIT
jgi:sphinganine-1-phosphate aldolase